MPELPEVETVVRSLEKRIKDYEIVDVDIRYAPIVVGDKEEFRNKLIHEHFRDFSRRGKYLIFTMDHYLLVAHLRMEGKFFLEDTNHVAKKHEHVIFTFSNGKKLCYHDTRKFGRMELLPLSTDMSKFHNLGPEPFDSSFNPEYIYLYCKHRNIPLKSLLLDQSFVAGVGNIYADEILFACSLRPGRSCKRITRNDAFNLCEETKRILKEAILEGGTTIRSYESEKGVHGRFQLKCMVHGNSTCKCCGSDIKIKRIGGRSSYYCPNCQK